MAGKKRSAPPRKRRTTRSRRRPSVLAPLRKLAMIGLVTSVAGFLTLIAVTWFLTRKPDHHRPLPEAVPLGDVARPSVVKPPPQPRRQGAPAPYAYEEDIKLAWHEPYHEVDIVTDPDPVATPVVPVTNEEMPKIDDGATEKTTPPSASPPAPVAQAPPLPAPSKGPSPKPRHDKQPRIAIVIDDMGLDRRHSRQIVEIGYALTLAYLPYAQELPAQTRQAESFGHEIIVHMPMEPSDLKGNNPGPKALLTGLSDEEFMARLHHNLSQFSGYVGINNHMGSSLTASPRAMAMVMPELAKRGVYFLDSRTNPNSIAYATARRHGVPALRRDVFLDHHETLAFAAQQLAETEKIARQRGFAIAIGHPKPATIQALGQWLPTLAAKGFMLVPASALLGEPFNKP